MLTNIKIICGVILVIILCTDDCLSSTSGEMKYIPKDWVDHTDMRYYDRHTKTMIKEAQNKNDVFYDENTINYDQNTNDLQNTPSPSNGKNEHYEINTYELFIKKLISQILHVSKLSDLEIKEGEKASSRISVRVTKKELNKLLHMEKKFTFSSLGELSVLFADILSMEDDSYENSKNRYISYSLFLYENFYKEYLLVIALLSTFGYAFWMFRRGDNYFRILSFLLLLFFMAGLGFTWKAMHDEAVVDHYVNQRMYDDCIPSNDGSWYEYFFGKVARDKDKCEGYYKARIVDPFFQVSPTVVLSETITAFFLYPAKKFGIAVSDFCIGIADVTPWPFNHIIAPLVFCILMIAVICVTSLYLGCSLKIWTYVGVLDIGRRDTNNVTERRGSSNWINRIMPTKRKAISNSESVNKIEDTPDRKNEKITDKIRGGGSNKPKLVVSKWKSKRPSVKEHKKKSGDENID